MSDMHSDAKQDERPYSLDELRRLVEFSISSEQVDIAHACLLTVHSVKASLPELCRQAIETHPHVTVAAWRTFGPHGCMEVFLSLLSHPEEEIRLGAVQTLRYVGGQEALVALKRACNDPSERVKLWARSGVKDLEGRPIELTTTPLRKPDALEQTIVALLLAREVPEAQMQHVVSLLHHPFDTLRYAVHESLAKSRAGADALYAELARDPKSLTRQVIRLLTMIGDDRARNLLLRVARSNNPPIHIYESCFEALQTFNWESAVDSLIELFWDVPEGYRDRQSDLVALFQRAGSQGVERLLDLFRRDEGIRRHGGQLLARVVGESALPVLLDALESPFRQVRVSAARGLIVLGLPAAQSLIQRLPKIASAPAQKVGLQALYYISEQSDFATPETLRCVAEMVSRRSTRTEALTLLGRLRSPISYFLLLPLLRSTDLTLARAAISICEQLFLGGVEPPVDIIRAVATLVPQPSVDLQRRALELLVNALHFSTEIQIVAMLALLELRRSKDRVLAGRVTEMLHAEPDTTLRAIDSLTSAGAADISDLEELRESLLAKRKELAAARREDSDKTRSDRDGWGSLHSPHSYPAGYEIPRPVNASTKMSVTAPKIVVPGSRFVLAVWVHRLGDRVILRHAQNLAPGKPITIQTKQALQIQDESVLKVVVELPGFQLDEESDTMYWNGDEEPIGNCTFGVTVPPDAAFGTHLGKVSLWLSSLRIAKLNIALVVGAEGAGVQDMILDEHRERTAFASYASEERFQVLARIQGMQKMVPDLHIFLDFMSIRAGEDWQNRLSDEIADCDLFLLFWSIAASRSQWVQREWQTALATKGLEAINPVPLQPPSVAPPPPELASLHFSDWTLEVKGVS